jgi:hypothetical protein
VQCLSKMGTEWSWGGVGSVCYTSLSVGKLKYICDRKVIVRLKDTPGITINVPFVYMARDVMILKRAISITRAI